MIKKKKFSRGGCVISKISPTRKEFFSKTPSLNLYISFEEALKLNLALQDRLLELNRFNRRIKAGARTCVNLTLHFSVNRLVVNSGSF